MAAQVNGRAKKGKKPAQNGYPNGTANGELNGHAVTTKPSGPVVQMPPRRKPRRGIVGYFTNLVARYVL
jgi:hypothetical protein